MRYYISMSVITINGSVIKSPSCVPRLSAVMNAEHVIRAINHPLRTVHSISGRVGIARLGDKLELLCKLKHHHCIELARKVMHCNSVAWDLQT